MYCEDAGFINPEDSVVFDRKLFSRGKEAFAIYSRNRPTVSLGRFGNGDCVAAEYRNKVCVVKRISGGSPIFSDEKQIVITYVGDRKKFENKMESYEFFCGKIIDALNLLKIKCEYKPANDILLNGKKISGCAQYRNSKTVLIHGTLVLEKSNLLDTSVKQKKEKKTEVTSIKDECGFIPERKLIFESLKTSFSE